MTTDDGIAELRRAIAAGEYEPSSRDVAAAVLTKLGIIRRARRRLEVLDGPRTELESGPPRRRFASGSQAAPSGR